MVEELCTRLFRCLARSDQRLRGLQYVRGLVGARGRKSVRNIAAAVGGGTAEQSLHHFVASSTWDWRPVRRALAHLLVPALCPQAWVIRPMVIPKVGAHTIGVGRRFVPDLGHVINAQQAVGVWVATETVSAPVDWRLHLPTGRGRDGLGEMLTPMLSAWDLPVLPIVLDARQCDPTTLVPALRATGSPFLVRVFGKQRFRPVDPALARRGDLSGHDLMAAVRDQRRPVHRRSAPGGHAQTLLVSITRVASPGDGPVRPLTLLGIDRPGVPDLGEWWLTDLTGTAPAELVALANLLLRVDHDLTTIADWVGIRDFAGRSYDGWHRHATLASVAHATVVLSRAAAVPVGAALSPCGAA
ncbi:IS701 family transposase [Micromonospora sp. SCSIO 07396]